MMVATGDDAKITVSMEDLRNIIRTELKDELKAEVKAELTEELRQEINNVPRFIDTSNLITTIEGQGASWTATQDCALAVDFVMRNHGKAMVVNINGVEVGGLLDEWADDTHPTSTLSIIYAKKGDIITTSNEAGGDSIKVYGLK